MAHNKEDERLVSLIAAAGVLPNHGFVTLKSREFSVIQIYVCACMCVCVCVCVRARVRMLVFVCMGVFMYVCVCVSERE